MWKIGGLLTLCILPLFAGLGDRVEELEKQMSEVGSINAMGEFGTEMRAAQPEVDGVRWYITGELLYWQAKIGGSEYTLSVGESNEVLSPPIKGTIKSNTFGWDIGGRLGVGLNLPHDSWDLFLNFTYYENHNTTSSTKPFPSLLLSQVGFFGGTFDKAKSTYDLTYLNLDLEFGRKFFISENLSVKTHVGVKGTRMLQENKVKLNFGPTQAGGTLLGEFYRVYNRCDFNGIGPRIGFEGNWHIGYGYRLINESSFSLLYSYFDVTDKERNSPGSTNTNANISLKGKFRRFIPYAQIFLGLGWGDYVHNDKYYFTLKAGYEVLYFWRENQCVEANDWNFVNNGGSNTNRFSYKQFAEDLSFYGITVKARLDF